MTTRVGNNRLCRRLARDTSGATLLYVALSLPAMIGVAGLVVDMSQIYRDKTRLQIAADAAAYAGTEALASGANVSNAAISIANLNIPPTARGGVLATTDVVSGTWSTNTSTFIANGNPSNAVQVTTRMNAANGMAPSGFAATLGIATPSVSAMSIGYFNAGSACSPSSGGFTGVFLVNNNVPRQTKITTSANFDGQGSTFGRTPDGHPILRVENSATSPVSIVVTVWSPGGNASQTFDLPSAGEFFVVNSNTTVNGGPPAVSVVYNNLAGSTATWRNTGRTINVANIRGTQICSNSGTTTGPYQIVK